MVYIVASYHHMQFQGKLINRTWENSRRPNFGPDFGLFGPNLGPKDFYLWILPLLDVRNCCKLSLYAISRKTNKPNLRKWQIKTSFRPSFGPFDSKKNFWWILPVLDVRTCCKILLYAISRKSNEQN